jgi:abequosyltransferase
VKTPLLSICIPTYNRAAFLDECLESLVRLDVGLSGDVEVIVSDNASTDNTREVVDRYQQLIPLRYFRNASNIGAERNVFAAAGHGSAEYVWVFGDDDIFEEAAVASVLQHIRLGYDLIILNYSVWSRKMDIRMRPRGLGRTEPAIYDEPNGVLASLGSHLGYISSVIVRKNLLISVPPEEYEPFVQYGFSHLYSIYCGLRTGCHAICLPDPVFKNRMDNCAVFIGEAAQSSWNKYFIEGTALIFEMLGRKGYSSLAVTRAKNQVLRDFVTLRILTGMKGTNRPALAWLMYRHYRWNWRFWIICLPALLVPRGILLALRKVVSTIRAAGRNILGKVDSASAG